MFCRKTPNRHQNQADLATWDQVQQESVYGLDGDRQFSGGRPGDSSVLDNYGTHKTIS
jgi:hypothetical protein